MAIERWTDQRLDKLAESMERLIGQLHLLGNQISQVGNRVEQTCNRVDTFVDLGRADPSPSADSNHPAPNRHRSVEQTVGQTVDQSSYPLDRLTALESQMQQLTQRVQYLERREVVLSPQVLPALAVEEEDIEDEPDEILWDFLDPAERQK